MANDVTTDVLEFPYRVTCGVYRKKDGTYGVIPWLEDESGKFVRFSVKDPKELEKDRQKDGWERINQFKPK